MLSLPDLDSGQEIVADNVRVLGTIYFASQLEEMRFFQVADRLVQLFEQGLLPLVRRGQGQRLLRAMATADERLLTHERRLLYAHALDAPDSEQSPAGHRDFHYDWLQFVASVTLFDARQDRACVQRAAIALAASASARGAGLREAAHRLAVDANRLRALFEAPDIQRAFGAQDMWQVIDKVSSAELGGAVNVARRRARAVASSSVLHWLADHARALNHASAFAADTLFAAVDQWLASSQSIDNASSDSASHNLAAMSNELLGKLGIDTTTGLRDPESKVIALFCGPAGTGKSLATHAVAANLQRRLVRIDLRRLVSKLIDETEKHLEAVLTQVENTDAILWFDEADALLGKRTSVQDALDRFADRDIGKFVQRLIATSNFVVFECRDLPKPTALQVSAVISFPLQPPHSRSPTHPA